jgi:pimeloyl-ACP methyl ester carboxylesterase
MYILTRRLTRLFLAAGPAIMRGMSAGTVHLNDIDIYYETEGEGEPLLLLHGATGCQENWDHSGRDAFIREYAVIKPDARGHGRTNNPRGTITHRQCALDMLGLLDHLGIKKCRAIGLSMGGNILLHMATMQPERIAAMVVVSAAMHFPDQARAIMRQVPMPESQSAAEWETMRRRHKLGDQQIVALWNWTRGMADSHDDMNFTAASLSKITAATLIVYGDRDPLYPVEMAVAMYRAIPRSALWGGAQWRPRARLLRCRRPLLPNRAGVSSNVGVVESPRGRDPSTAQPFAKRTAAPLRMTRISRLGY